MNPRSFAFIRGQIVFFENPKRIALLLAGLCLIAYWPAFNNGFISDDYVLLERVETRNPVYFFSIPPENFRLTSYVVFALFKGFFGYHAELYYAFTILLHILNSFLFFLLLQSITAKRTTAAVGSVLFATFQDPQEAVMWLAGMNEALLGAAALATLIFWRKQRYLWSAACYFGALFSGDSVGIGPLATPPTALCAAVCRVQYRLHLDSQG